MLILISCLFFTSIFLKNRPVLGHKRELGESLERLDGHHDTEGDEDDISKIYGFWAFEYRKEDLDRESWKTSDGKNQSPEDFARFSMKHDRLCVENTETPSYRYRTQGIDSLSKEMWQHQFRSSRLQFSSSRRFRKNSGLILNLDRRHHWRLNLAFTDPDDVNTEDVDV